MTCTVEPARRVDLLRSACSSFVAMRDPAVALYVLGALTIALSARRLTRSSGHRLALLGLGLQLLIAALATLTLPLLTWWHPAKFPQFAFLTGCLAAMIAVPALARHPAQPLARLAAALAARPWRQHVSLTAASVILALGAAEFVTSSAVRASLARRYTPTEARLAQETEDWRLAHVMSDAYREPDPVLLWRPVAREPYSSQRFRGPEVALAKPPQTRRVICYGDSNTDGPPAGGAWPEALAEMLHQDAAGSHVEVLNAGVAGYSSYQGARRFEQEVDVYRPDVVLVSFGWNDAANAIGADDKTFAATTAFQAADPWRVHLRRMLFRYDTVLVTARLVTASRAVPQGPQATVLGARVSVDDYAENLRAIARRAAAARVRLVLMTRPHRERETELAQFPGWRRRVPEYNAAARRVADEAGVPLVDAQRAFDGQLAAFADESHLTRDGHRHLGQLVHDVLREHALVP